MAKGKKSNDANKAALKAAKRKKQQTKADKLAKKTAKRKGELLETEEDLLKTLEELRLSYEAEHAVNISLESGPPSRRANASFIACPVSTDLYLFGGEFFDGKTCTFYPDLFRYSTDKNEWRKIASQNAPGPRSAHQMVASPAGGGALWLFGGEYAAANGQSFLHFRDLWRFSIPDQTWERFDTRIRPSARSGHRMAIWKHWIVLFGGFQDTGQKTHYLSDLWLFDLDEFRWHEVVQKEFDRKPTARSGFSFLPSADGIVLHGGYCKVYSQKRAKGMALDDTWLLRLDAVKSGSAFSSADVKWEKRKKVGFVPNTRSGATMTLWSSKNMGVLFGGVYDDDTNEETLESVFFNDMFGYQLQGNGRWVSLNLKKAQGSKRRRRAKAEVPVAKKDSEDEHANYSDEEDADSDVDTPANNNKSGTDGAAPETMKEEPPSVPPPEIDTSVPCQRYNAMLAIQKNTLYLYGGILETKSLEATLDDFYTIDLTKMKEWTCLRESPVVWAGEDDDEDDDADSGSDSDSSSSSESEVFELPSEVPGASRSNGEPLVRDLDKKVEAFLAVSKLPEESRSVEDELSTPKVGETLKTFYERTREYWAGKAYDKTANRGKQLKRDGFGLAEERFESYRPILEEIARIHAKAAVEAEDLKNSGGINTSENRNRR